MNCRVRALWVAFTMAITALAAPIALAEDAIEDAAQRVEVADPFIELHTGAGSSYPIFHVVDRGETVELLKRKNDWFKVRTRRGKEGWVSREQIQKTLNPDGSVVESSELTQDDFSRRRWEGGALGGDFGGAAVISVYGAYQFTPNISTEVSVSHAIGDVSNSVIFGVNLVHQPFPLWRYSPFVSLGTGVINTEPNATLVAAEDRTDEILHVGLGVKTFIGRRFVLRGEFKQYTVITSRNDNESVEEWKIGISVFFQ